jgi:adenosine deaminase
MKPSSRSAAVFGEVLVLIAGIIAPAVAATPSSASNEARTAGYFESIRKDPNLLLPFLREMPKGGDLHNHLSGAIYAESLIQWAADAKDCADPKTLTIVAGPCSAPQVPASDALANPALYASMIDAFSMRNWQLSGQSGHDHFFDTFGKFGQATDGAVGKMLAETAARAASQHEVYQELMLTPTGKDLETLAKSLGWNDDFGVMQQKLLEKGLPQMLATASQQIRAAEAARDKLLDCGGAKPDPGCQIPQRFLFQVARGKPKEVVFAQILSGFLMAGAEPNLVPPDPHVVGLNLVMPEDWYVPIRDFSLHMRILDYLHKKYPHVHIALHAGELVEGLVPPEDLQFHVRDSVAIGHAERVGHGVDVMNETRPFELLREMAGRNVMVEICLTSNDVILGVSGAQHPLREYISAGVPVALATDDEGVARSDMTHEYLRGAQDQGLSYLQLKKMARTSLEHAFISGASLWGDGSTFTVVKECAAGKPGAEEPPAICRKFLDGSEKAQLQWKLEADFNQFESQRWPASAKAAP